VSKPDHLPLNRLTGAKRIMTTMAQIVLPGSHRAPSPGARVVGAAPADEWIEVTLKLRRKAPLPAITCRPSKILSRAELGAKYGAAPQDIAHVTKAFEAYGLEVVDSNPAARSVRLGGPLHAMEKAFRVKLFRYSHSRGSYRGRVGELQIPSELKQIVVGVFGLDNRPVVKPRATHAVASPAKVMRGLARSPAQATTKRRAWFFPAELAEIYQFPSGDGSGQSIGLIEFGGGYFPDDLRSFCSHANISMPNVIPISVDHQPTDARDGAEGEVMLDVEVVAGICPGAKIPVYFSSFDEQGWVEVLDEAIHDETNAPMVLSISWGMAEDDPNWSRGAIDVISDSLHAAALAGITVCVASGDDGSGDQERDGHAHVDFPASSPNVLAVGGTSLSIRDGRPVEVVWKDGDGTRAHHGGSTGGGVSIHFPRPAWQDVSIPSVNPNPIDGRVVPDVAALAQSDGRTTGYFCVVDGRPGLNGGTSAATPLWAALIARMNAALGSGKRLPFLTPLLYGSLPGGTGSVASAGCTDITSGNNDTAVVGGYSATVGFDAVTGWGSPLGTLLLQAMKKAI
jgi:kumamolisin